MKGSKLAEAESYLEDYGDLGMLDGIAQEYIERSKQHRRKTRRNWIVGATVGSLTLISLTIWAGISSFQSSKLALNSDLRAESTNIKYGVSVGANLEELIKAIEITAQSQTKQKFLGLFELTLEPTTINEVNSALLSALDKARGIFSPTKEK